MPEYSLRHLINHVAEFFKSSRLGNMQGLADHQRAVQEEDQDRWVKLEWGSRENSTDGYRVMDPP